VFSINIAATFIYIFFSIAYYCVTYSAFLGVIKIYIGPNNNWRCVINFIYQKCFIEAYDIGKTKHVAERCLRLHVLSLAALTASTIINLMIMILFGDTIILFYVCVFCMSAKLISFNSNLSQVTQVGSC